jgi:hypothetical protein
MQGRRDRSRPFPRVIVHSLDHDRLRRRRARRLAKHDQERQDRERRNHQKFVIVDIGDDLRLLGDDGIERSAARSGERIPGVRNRRMLEATIVTLGTMAA